MAIDKESSGLPEVDFHRATTKVNLGIIIAAALFFAITFGLVYYYARNVPVEQSAPSPPTKNLSQPLIEPEPAHPRPPPAP